LLVNAFPSSDEQRSELPVSHNGLDSSENHDHNNHPAADHYDDDHGSPNDHNDRAQCACP
jgi:hypothetical protein